MSTITVYTTPGCPQCSITFRALDKANLDYITVDLTTDEAALARVKELGYSRAPVVVTDSDHWSGFLPDKISAL